MATRDSSPEAPPLPPAEKDAGPEADGEQVFQFDDSRKLGVVSAVFLILNKMIGTGSKWGSVCVVVLGRPVDNMVWCGAVFSTPSGIYAATGNVGVSIVLWVVGGLITFSGLSVFVLILLLHSGWDYH